MCIISYMKYGQVFRNLKLLNSVKLLIHVLEPFAKICPSSTVCECLGILEYAWYCSMCKFCEGENYGHFQSQHVDEVAPYSRPCVYLHHTHSAKLVKKTIEASHACEVEIGALSRKMINISHLNFQGRNRSSCAEAL